MTDKTGADHFVGGSTGALCFCGYRKNGAPLVASGTCQGSVNEIALWEYRAGEVGEDEPFPPPELVKRHEQPHPSAVTSLKAVFKGSERDQVDSIVSTSANGSVNVMKVDDTHAGVALTWQTSFAAHVPQWANGTACQSPYHSSAVTDCDVYGAYVISVSEEGGMIRHDLSSEANIHHADLNHADCAALNAVCFKQDLNLVITAGSSPSSQLKLWDLRTPKGIANSFQDPDTGVEYYSLAKHDSRPDLIAAGTDKGRIALWDIRKSTNEEGLIYLQHEGMHAETGRRQLDSNDSLISSFVQAVLPS
jgi:WD40 repeat protein